MAVLAGPGGMPLAKGVAERLGEPLLAVAVRAFPDGELLVRLPELPPGPLALVQSTFAPQSTRLLELFFMLDVLREQGRSATVVVPYFGYGRQDKAFNPGEPASAHAILRILSGYPVERLVLVDPHFHRRPGAFSAQGLNALALSAAPVVVGAVSEELDDPLVISPDQGSALLARGASASSRALTKSRTGDREVAIAGERLDVEGRDVVVFDDLVSTGGTMAEAVRMVRMQRAARVVAACTHGLFLERADERILEAGADDVVCTDTVPGPRSAVSVAPLVADALAGATRP